MAELQKFPSFMDVEMRGFSERMIFEGGAISYDTVESNHMKHDKEGLLSMSRRDKKASSSKFLINLKADQSLDSSHVIFGRFVGGLITLRNIGDVCFRSPIKIVKCGVQYDGYVPRGVTLRTGEDDAKWIKWFEEGKMKKRVEDWDVWGDWPWIDDWGR